MTSIVHRREFDVFLSHAHSDKQFVDQLYHWLAETAGLRVWYDARELSGGALIASDLQTSIERCRGVVLVASEEALKSGWVKQEYNVAADELARSGGEFRLVPLRLNNAPADTLVRGLSWIDLPHPQIDLEGASAILAAFYPGEKRPDPRNSRDVFVSASWRRTDSASARTVCRALVDEGFRLIGDARDQAGFDEGNRVASIIGSCGALVSILPFRDEQKATPTDGPYKYFLREADLAGSLGLPTLIIADPRIAREDGPDDHWLKLDTKADVPSDEVADAIAALWDDWRAPPRPHYVFCAMDLESPMARPASAFRRLVERVTAMPTVVGNEILEPPLQASIRNTICGAFLVLADISDPAGERFNLDVCIEAGMARATGRNLELMVAGRSRRPPFMLRDLQLQTYADDVEQLGILHRIVRRYRRRVINAEL